ncbi:response regulator [Aliiglaciecola sp. CAU 1673]|uniref:response regulator n=1 Tax=Aliiglaciecola sp. CAU 1673 TaxID=3032595 RepID=UPI0023DB4B50|nr:response regulator [Aliiglaciecola sp. CAU 1673]MDF2176707.1 response regulator [Aliiglaciecola sp. CAU 1673]
MDTNRPVALLVDDEKANLRLLSELLRQDMDIALAISGYQALDKACKLKPDLILLDVVMPELDGFETLKALQTNASTKDIPVIFVTGLDSAHDEEKGLRLGAKDYIAKPFSPEVVKARVNAQLEIIHQRQKLQQVSQELALADEAKSRFLANMSHEIRTPLTTVIGYAEAILAGEFREDEQQQALAAISQNGKHLLELLNDILDLAKIEDNRLEIEKLPVDLMGMLEEIRVLFADKALKKGLAFQLSPQFPLPSQIITDPTRLKQILVNLVGNAIKFTEKGFVQIRISCEPRTLIFEVKDSGIGIAKEQQTLLFDAFTQAEASVNRLHGGTGLGLAISKDLALKLGGDISLLSEKGQGSCFIFHMNLHEGPDNQWLTTIPLSPQKISQQHAGKSKVSKLSGRVLLADDYNEGRELVCRMLQTLGVQVTQVSDGAQLLEKSLAEHFDLILTDINMPVMNGAEALRLLRSAGIDTPVIALTANAMTHDVESYLQQGFAGHLAKPIVRDHFFRLMQQFLLPEEQGEKPPLQSSKEMIALKARFISSLPARLDAIKQAIQQQDLPQLQQAAHTLKGAAALFEQATLTQLAKSMENVTDFKAAGELYAALMAASKQLH